MNSKIVQVTPIEEYFSISWQLGIRCNYDCMYCSPKWHDSTSKYHSLEKMQDAWLKIYEKTSNLNLPYKISFIGGELTTNKNFLPFVTWLRNNYSNRLFKLLLTTNGSANFKYYSKMFDAIDNISFSVHSEFINETKFFNMLIQLKQSISNDRFMHVDIMNEFWNQDRILKYKQLLEQHNISYSVNEVDYSYQTRQYPIMQGQLNLEV
jgi:molybdenum cofactor biosynthesis enzyme MoaA